MLLANTAHRHGCLVHTTDCQISKEIFYELSQKFPPQLKCITTLSYEVCVYYLTFTMASQLIIYVKLNKTAII